MALKAKSTLDYSVIGFVNTRQIISGLDDWLFYKAGFQSEACLTGPQIEMALNRTKAMRVLASAADIDFRVSISPDKEVVYPDRLGPRGFQVARCKLDNAKAWRRINADRGFSIIDHLAAMDRAYSQNLLYYRTDTHWNELGQSMALRQLAQLYLQRDPGLPDRQYVESTKLTDMLGGMLHLEMPEISKTYPAYWREFERVIGEGVDGPAVIVHDSFYAGPIRHLKSLFPEARFFMAAKAGEIPTALMSGPKHLLTNIVERNFMAAVNRGSLSWSGEIGRGLIAVNGSVAQACEMAPVALASVKLRNMFPDEAGGFTTGIDPQMLIRLPEGGKPCLQVSFTTSSKGGAQLFLPTGGKEGGYQPGLSVDYVDVGKSRVLTVVLPSRYADTTVRIDPVPGASEISKLSISVGHM